MRLGEQTDIEVAENLNSVKYPMDYPWKEKLPVKAVMRYLSIPDKSENFIRVKQDVLSIVQIFDVVMSGTWWKALVEKARPACFRHSLGFLELVMSVNKPFYLVS